MKKKFLVILFLIAALSYTVYLMLEYEEEIRSDHIIVKTVEDESRPLLERLPYEALKDQSDEWTYRFKTGKRYFIHYDLNGNPDTIFLKGVNLGVAVPGKFPAEFSLSFDQYLDWLIQIGNMHANVIRLYTILPPDFYKALNYYNEHYARQPLYVLHGVWAKIPPKHNYFDPVYTNEFMHEIKDVIDVIHGNAVLKPKPGKASGTYATDISPYVAGLLLGREWEPDAVYQTVRKNSQQNHYNGVFISLPRGNPMEVWLARMLDFAVQYETQTYQTQRPVSFVNWLPLDPMYHNSEFIENKKVREYDNDLMQVDFSRFHATGLFKAGLYAAYHAYPYYPDFIYLDKKYRNATRNGISDHYFAYLKDLKNHNQGLPLVIAEYGLPTSRGISHFAPSDFNQGGHSETGQAVKSLKLTRDILRAGCGGAVYFEWIDEWFKHNWLVMDFEIPFEDRKLWHNMENPEQNFGIIAMESKKIQIDGQTDDWKPLKPLENTGGKIFAAADPTYFYIAAQLDNVDWSQNNVYIALDTYDKEKGDHRLPFSGKTFERGFEFLVQFQNPDHAKILVDEPYSVFTDIYNDYIPVYASKPNANGRFIDELMLVNRKRESLTGEIFDSIINNRSPLQSGFSQNPSTSNADWYWNPQKKFLELRLDWHLINVSDPAKKYVLDDKPQTKKIEASQTDGFRFILFITDKQNHIVQQIPQSGYAFFTWENWDQPAYTSRPKPLYDSLRNYFARLKPNVKIPEDQPLEKPEITPFKDGKTGAVSILFPEGDYSSYQLAFPLLEKYHLQGCFGMDVALKESQAFTVFENHKKIKKNGRLQFLSMHKKGQCITPAVFPSQNKRKNITEPFTGKPPSAILYKNSIKFQTPGAAYPLPFTPPENPHYRKKDLDAWLYDASALTPAKLDSLLRQNRNRWTVLYYGQIIKNSKDSLNPGTLDYENFRRQIRLTRNSGYWIAPAGEIYRYLTERKHARIHRQSFKNFDLIEISTGLSPEFNVPLTLKYPLKASKIKVSGSSADGFYENRVGYVLLQIKPGQQVKIEKFD